MSVACRGLRLEIGLLAMFGVAACGSEEHSTAPEFLGAFPSFHESPAYSPDGRWLVYTVAPTGQRAVDLGQAYELWMYDGDLGEVRFETDGRDATWSADGGQIAFVRGVDLWLRSLDQGTERQLTDGIFCRSPSWRPGSSTVLFGRWDGQEAETLWTVDVESGALEQLRDGNMGTWSPDGNHLAVVEPSRQRITLVSAADSAERLLVEASGGTGLLLWPSWSWDGSRVRYNLWSGRQESIYEIAFDGTGGRLFVGNARRTSENPKGDSSVYEGYSAAKRGWTLWLIDHKTQQRRLLLLPADGALDNGNSATDEGGPE